MGTLIVKPATKLDTDTRLYIDAVETADGDFLEYPIKKAVDSFIKGCKRDGVWDSIHTSGIWGISRTITGALIPIKGNTPSIVSNSSLSYIRKQGIRSYLGAGSGIDLNYADDLSSLNNRHSAFYATYLGLSGTGRTFANSSTLSILRNGPPDYGLHTGINAGSYRVVYLTPTTDPAFIALNQPHGFRFRDEIVPVSNYVPESATNHIYGSPANPNNSYCGFYSFGTTIDTTKLKSRIIDLFTAVNSTLP